MSIGAMLEAVRGELPADLQESGMCHACFSGDYPIPVDSREHDQGRQLRLIGV